HHPEHIELFREAPRQGWQERGDEAAHVIGAAGHASMLVVVGHDVVVAGPGIKERASTGTVGGAGAMAGLLERRAPWSTDFSDLRTSRPSSGTWAYPPDVDT